MHKQAAINTVILLTKAFGITILALIAFQYMSVNMILGILGVAFLAYMVNIVYNIEKSRLNHIESINKLKEKQYD